MSYLPEWIPIAERLPAYGTEVIVTDGGEVAAASRSHTDQDGEHFDCAEGEFENVTYWMPLPEPPPEPPK